MASLGSQVDLGNGRRLEMREGAAFLILPRSEEDDGELMLRELTRADAEQEAVELDDSKKRTCYLVDLHRQPRSIAMMLIEDIDGEDRLVYTVRGTGPAITPIDQLTADGGWRLGDFKDGDVRCFIDDNGYPKPREEERELAAAGA